MVRFIYLLSCFMHYRLYEWLPIYHRILFYPLYICVPWSLYPNFCQSKEDRLRKGLEQMGPIFIKFGQLLSTRKDLISLKLISELSKLQDRVPPFSQAKARLLCQKALGDKFNDIIEFSNEPLASASIAQVHKATLKDLTAVVLKIRRPNLIKRIKSDLFLMKILAYLITYVFGLFRFRFISVIKEFEQALLAEVDFIREASHAAQLKRNFMGDDRVYIPKIYWEYSSEDVLMLEYLQSPSIQSLLKQGMSSSERKILAEQIFLVFLKQVFEDSFFHADMHPGNIFVKRINEGEFQLQLVDFGIVGVLSRSDLRYLAENLLAFFEQDYHRVAILHVQSGWVPSNISIQNFEFSIRRVCEPIFQRPLNQISVGETFMQLIQVAQDYKVIVQPQLILLQKTILVVEGLSRELYPELDLWERVYPYVRDQVWVKYKPLSEFKNLAKKIPLFLDKLNDKLIKEQLPPPQRNTSQELWVITFFSLSVLLNTTLFFLKQYPSYKEYFLIILFHVIVYRYVSFIEKSAYYE